MNGYIKPMNDLLYQNKVRYFEQGVRDNGTKCPYPSHTLAGESWKQGHSLRLRMEQESLICRAGHCVYRSNDKALAAECNLACSSFGHLLPDLKVLTWGEFRALIALQTP